MALCLSGACGVATAQSSATAELSVTIEPAPSPAKAFGLSMLVPGLGGRYVNGGQWTRWSGFLAASDAAMWVGLFAGTWHRDQVVQSYRTLASVSANADLEDKNRTFYLNMARFRSSDEFLETMLRNRAWDQIDYVADPSFHWSWQTEADFQRYRDLRDDSESLGRRRSMLIAGLVANRIISGLVAARKAGARSARAQQTRISAGFAPPVGARPVFSLRIDY